MNGVEASKNEPKYLVIFDGVCGFCDLSVQWLLKWDTHGIFWFSPNQGEAFQRIHPRYPDLNPDGSIIFIVQSEGEAGEKVYTHSEAIFQILKRLPFPHRALSYFSIFPRFLTDAVYNFIGKHRLKIWGTVPACDLPTPEKRARFLN